MNFDSNCHYTLLWPLLMNSFTLHCLQILHFYTVDLIFIIWELMDRCLLLLCVFKSFDGLEEFDDVLREIYFI